MPLYGEQGGGRGALGIPGACAEPVQSAETRSSGLRVVAEVANQIGGYSPTLRLTSYAFEEIASSGSAMLTFCAGKPGYRP
jgi:hypothetical protein